MRHNEEEKRVDGGQWGREREGNISSIGRISGYLSKQVKDMKPQV